jgi:ABC-type spermidine/putrescine transport system permease subunit II
MWDGIRTEINPTIAAVSTLLVLMSLFILLTAALTRKHLDKKNE